MNNKLIKGRGKVLGSHKLEEFMINFTNSKNERNTCCKQRRDGRCHEAATLV